MEVRTVKYGEMDLVNPIAVIGFPSVGLVSSITANLLIAQKSMTPIAGMSSPDMPPYCLFHNGVAMPPVRFFGLKGAGKKGDDLIVCMTEYSPKPECCYDLAHAILNYLRSMGCTRMICLEGVPKFSTEEEVVICGTGPQGERMVRRSKLRQMDTGMIKGMTGVFLCDGVWAGISTVAMLCPASQNLPDPGSAKNLLPPINRIVTGLRATGEQLDAEAAEIQKKVEEQEAHEKVANSQFYG